MSTPCDIAVLQSARAEAPCKEESRLWILLATILASSMAFIDGTVVNVTLPAIQGSFHATVAGVQWVVESYGLFLGALVLAGGALGDRFGRRQIFLAGVVIFTAASAFCGLATSIQMLVAARSVQGLGAALLVPGSLAIISTSFDEKHRGQAIGTWSGFTAITTALGPVLGGWLVEHASWRWAFFINLPLAAAVIVISLWHVPESRRPNAGPIDWAGTLSVTLGLGGLVNGFIESVNLGWRHPVVAGSLIGGAICLAMFLLIEMRASAPMVPLGLFASRSFSGANLLTLFLYAAVGIFFFLFPLNLIQVQGYSATATGAASLPMILLMFLLSRWSGGLVARYGPKAPLVIGPFVVAIGFFLFSLPSTGASYWTSFFPAVVVLGLGMAVTVAPLTTVVMNSLSQQYVGTASGINNAVARVASVLAIAVLGIAVVNAFASQLNHKLSSLSLPPAALHSIQTEENRLAGLQLPDGLDAGLKTEIQKSVREAFVFAFRLIMLICAGFSIASSAVAWLLVPGGLLFQHNEHVRSNG
jgi:EmrB/QacA subfamily drug resistance transporter